MRRIVMFDWVSVDGCFAGPAGDLDWVVPDQEQAKWSAATIASFDTVLFGRRTYEIFAAFWASMVVDAAGTVPDPHDPGRRSPEHGRIATPLNTMVKVVFSKTLEGLTWKNSRLLRELDPREIRLMKEQPGKDLIVFGSGSIVSRLSAHDLIDEYQLVVCPIILGSGQALFRDLSTRTRVSLLEAKAMRSGDVMLRYGRVSAQN